MTFNDFNDYKIYIFAPFLLTITKYAPHVIYVWYDLQNYWILEMHLYLKEINTTPSGPIYKSSTAHIVQTKEWWLVAVTSLNWSCFIFHFHLCPSSQLLNES